MKALCAAVMLASPAAAFEAMTLNDCRNAWIAATETIEVGFVFSDDAEIDLFQSEVLRVQTTLTQDGWCRLTGGTEGLEKAAFNTLDWQAEGIDQFIKDGVPPLAFRTRARGLSEQPNATRRYDLDLTLRQVPEVGLLVVESFDLADHLGDWVSLTAVVQGAYLGSRSSMLSSLGGMTLQQAAGRVVMHPDRLTQNVLPDVVLTDDVGLVTDMMLDGLDAVQLPDTSRDALMALRNDVPDAQGDLFFNAQSERGLGWLQIGLAMSRSDDATDAEMLGFALSGVTFDVTWTPVE